MRNSEARGGTDEGPQTTDEGQTQGSAYGYLRSWTAGYRFITRMSRMVLKKNKFNAMPLLALTVASLARVPRQIHTYLIILDWV